eukprot:IDg4270t1
MSDLQSSPVLPSLPPPPSVQERSPSPPPTSQRRGRRSTFTAQDDLIVLREVMAAKAHIARNGKKMERYDDAAGRVWANRDFFAAYRARGDMEAVSGKKVRDRYERLQ